MSRNATSSEKQASTSIKCCEYVIYKTTRNVIGHRWNQCSRFLGICGGSWATTHWLSRIIDSRLETLTEVNVRIERARETLAEMQETTWGVELREISGERYVALPVRTPVRSAFTMDERPYLKLSRE